MQALIEVDLPEAIFREWEPVAIRPAIEGEFVLFMNRTVQPCPRHSLGEPSLILRRRFQWPGFLSRIVRCLTWDGSGTAYAWHVVPFFCASRVRWMHGSGEGYDCGFVMPKEVIDLPFPGGDWKTRIEENPNWCK